MNEKYLDYFTSLIIKKQKTIQIIAPILKRYKELAKQLNCKELEELNDDIAFEYGIEEDDLE